MSTQTCTERLVWARLHVYTDQHGETGVGEATLRTHTSPGPAGMSGQTALYTNTVMEVGRPALLYCQQTTPTS